MATLKDSAYNSPAAFTITLASLASSTTGVGRQSDEIDNTSTRFNKLEISVNTKLGTTPTASTAVYLYLIRNNNDGTPIRDDNAGASDAGITIINAQLVGVLVNPGTTTGQILKANFIVENPGPKWAIAIVNSTGANLDATGGNHVVSWAGITIDIS